MIELCNVTGNDMWLNVPCYADEQYIRELAKLVHDNLDPALKVYLEWGNETWNGMFVGPSASRKLAARAGLGESAWLGYTTYASMRLFKAFLDAFDDDGRLVKVIAGQNSNFGVLNSRMTKIENTTYNPWNISVDAIATTAYFGANAFQATGNNSVETFRTNRGIADQYGADYVAYEGGMSTGNTQGHYDIYMKALGQIEPYMSMFNQYVLIRRQQTSDSWGAKYYAGQPMGTDGAAPNEYAHKYRALYDLALENAQFAPNVTYTDADFVARATPIGPDGAIIKSVALRPAESVPRVYLPSSRTPRSLLRLAGHTVSQRVLTGSWLLDGRTSAYSTVGGAAGVYVTGLRARVAR
jgi:hypothetical protein